jgi:ABC-2 type transport system ATP-binding protein
MRDRMNEVTSSGETVITIANLTRRFGSKTALHDVSLDVPRGSVYGLVGENGAGKSTLIKHILGLWRTQSGSVRVFGLDPVSDPVSVLGRIGYLSEQPEFPEWMRVHEFIRYTQAFYPKWDGQYAEGLRDEFGLDATARIKSLSKGQRAKLGLLAAQAHRPDLLLLDEPSSGLDPIVRSDILAAIIRTVADEGRTVFFSSHLLEEIERVSDHIAMLHQGKLVLCGLLDEIKARHRRLTVRFEAQLSKPPIVPGALSVTGAGREWTIVCDSAQPNPPAITTTPDARITDEDQASLNEIFVAHAGASIDPSSVQEHANA